MGEPVSNSLHQVGWSRDRAEFSTGNYDVILEATKEHADLLRSLKEHGGYAITHQGQVHRKKGGHPLSFARLMDCL